MGDPAHPWLQSAYEWQPALLQADARPSAKAGAPVPPSRKGATGHPVCQVEGCRADLSDLRYFFRKQRICEQHARADVVTDAAGRQLRFCQQCTRLEPLSSFSSGRRSCKASLAKRQARAHRGKAHSSPDSSPERGPAPAAANADAASGLTNSSDGSIGASSAKGGSRRSGGGGGGGGGAPSSKRSRGSSPSRSGGALAGAAAVAAAMGSRPACTVSPPTSRLAGYPSNGTSMTQLPPLPVTTDAAATMSAPLMPRRPHSAGQVPAQQPGQSDGLAWSSGLSENDIEELLAMDPDDLADVLLVPGKSAPHDMAAAAAQQRWMPASAPLPAVTAAGMLGPRPQQQRVQQLPMPSQHAPWSLPPASGPIPMQQLHTGSGFSPPPPQQQHLQLPAGVGHMPPARRPASAPMAPTTGLWPGSSSRAAAAGPAAPSSSQPMSGGAGGSGGPAGGGHFSMPLHGAGPGSGDWSGGQEAAQVASLHREASGVGSALLSMYPAHVITRFSFKIFGVDPEQLPPTLRAELLAALQVSPTVLEGAIRCGCTHLVADVLLTAEESQQLATAPRLSSAVAHLRRRECWRALPAAPAIVAQEGPLVALGTAAANGTVTSGGAPLPCIYMGGVQLLPRLHLAGPLATTTGAAAGAFRFAVTPSAGGALPPATLAEALRCRSHGQLVGMAVAVVEPGQQAAEHSRPGSRGSMELSDIFEEGSEFSSLTEEGLEAAQAEMARQAEAEGAAAEAAAQAGASLLRAWAPAAVKEDGWGLYEFEMTSGSLLSDALPVLVLPDSHAAAAAELCQLQQTAQLGQQEQQAQQEEQAEGEQAEAGEPAAGEAAAVKAQPPAPAMQALPAVAVTVVRLIGMVLRYLHLRKAADAAGADSAASAAFAAAYPPPAAQRLSAVAQWLAAFALRARWAHVAGLVLPAVTADGSAAAAAARQLDALCAPAPSAIHLAVASGSAATLSALRGWAEGHGLLRWPELDAGSSSAPAGEQAAGASSLPAEHALPAMDLLLLAAAVGPGLEAGVAEQLQELMGRERFARAADATGPGGWTPRAVAQSTGNAALLAALPGEQAAASLPSSAPAAGAAAPQPAVPPSLPSPPLKAHGHVPAGRHSMEEDAMDPWFAGGSKPGRHLGKAASFSGKELLADFDDFPEGLLHSPGGSTKLRPAGGAGGKAPAVPFVSEALPAPPSYDAALLEELLEEMDVPRQEGSAAGRAGAAATPPASPRSLGSQLLAGSLAGTTAAVLAAVAALAVRSAFS